MASIRKRIWKNDAAETVTYQVDYKDQSGKRCRKQFKKRKDADAFMVNARAEVVAGVHTTDRDSITIAQAADIWLEACRVGRGENDPVEPHTLRVYRQHVELHIKPLIGGELLSRLTAPRAALFREQLLETRSRSMVKRVLVSFRALISEAQTRGLVAQNVAHSVKIKMAARHKKEVEIPTKAEMKTILDTAAGWANSETERTRRAWGRYHALLLAAVHTGMRASELRGLYWEHIDTKKGVITVRQRADENGLIGPVKSGAGRRDIPIGPSLLSALKRWELQSMPGPLVFGNGQGNVDSLRNIRARCWVRVCSVAGLMVLKGEGASLRYTFHAMRHFHASMLIASGATAKEVQVEMGHSSIQTTFDIYGHIFKDAAAEQRASVRAAALEVELQ